MKITTLNERIRTLATASASRLALVGKGFELTFQDLSKNTDQFFGRRVGIICQDIELAVRAMVAADGRAQSIALLSSRLSHSDIDKIVTQGHLDMVVGPGREAPELRPEDLFPSIASDEAKGKLYDPEVPTEWLVATSGTTSSPKLVRHSTSTLSHRIRSRRTDTDKPEVWGLFYDIARFAGLEVFFQSVVSGNTLVAPSDEDSLSDQLKFMRENGVSHLSATPTMWRKVLMTGESDRLALKQVTLGGEVADQKVLSALRARFPKARVTHVYASTEAGVGFWVSDGQAGFPTSFLRSNPGRPELQLRDGHLWVRSGSTGAGYLYEDSSMSNGWVDTGDIVEVRGDRLHILGRGSQVLNIGGDKVIPDKIRQVLLECDLVLDAFVFGRTNPFTGNVVVAQIVLNKNTNPEIARTGLEDFINRRLSKIERPRIVRFVDVLRTNATGKAVQ